MRLVGIGIRAFLLGRRLRSRFPAAAQVALLSGNTEKLLGMDGRRCRSRAIFIGASFRATSVLFAWGCQQREWIRVRAVVSGGPFVTVGLLVATLHHVDEFHGAVGRDLGRGLRVRGPAFFGRRCARLLPPAATGRSTARLRSGCASCSARQALAMLVSGVLLFARPGRGGDVWPWPLSPLAAEATAAWLLGIGGSTAYIALRGDREDMPGTALSYIVIGTIWIAGAIFGGDAFHNGLDATLSCCSRSSVVAVGVAGATLSHREGRLHRHHRARRRRSSRLSAGHVRAAVARDDAHAVGARPRARGTAEAIARARSASSRRAATRLTNTQLPLRERRCSDTRPFGTSGQIVPWMRARGALHGA